MTTTTPMGKAAVALLWKVDIGRQARWCSYHTFDFWCIAHGRLGPQTSRLHPVQALLRWTGQGVCRNVGPSHPCREVLALPGSQNFQQYIHIDRSLKPLLMRPSLVLVRKALDRMWFRRHWYWPSGYIVVGIIVALLTNNIHLSSLSGILLSILAVLLWPFILGAALCRLLGFHIPGIDIT
jgi:hypothetical protein